MAAAPAATGRAAAARLAAVRGFYQTPRGLVPEIPGGGPAEPQYATATGGWNNPVVRQALAGPPGPTLATPPQYQAPRSQRLSGIAADQPYTMAGPVDQLLGPAIRRSNARAILATPAARQRQAQVRAAAAGAAIYQAGQQASIRRGNTRIE